MPYTNSQDYGGQTKSFVYREEARSQLFNKIFYNLLPYGIYSGGELTRFESGTSVSVSPLTCVIEDANSNGIGIKIDTTEAQTITVDSSKDYIILRFGWEESESCYMAMLNVASSDIRSYDLIVGRINFTQDESGDYIIDPDNPFDYTERSNLAFIENEQYRTLFRVTENSSASLQLSVGGGTVVTSEGRFVLPGATFPAEPISIPTESERIDVVAIKPDGELVYIMGQESSEPECPQLGNTRGLALVHLTKNTQYISNADITNLITADTIHGPVSPESTTFEDPEGHFPEDKRTLTAALLYLWEYTFLNTSGEEVDDHLADFITDLKYPLGALFIDDDGNEVDGTESDDDSSDDGDSTGDTTEPSDDADDDDKN